MLVKVGTGEDWLAGILAIHTFRFGASVWIANKVCC